MKHGRAYPLRGIAEQRAADIINAAYYFGPAYGFVNLDPLLVLAQSALETGNFTSRMIAEDNNAFGMRQPTQRPTTSLGAGPSGFARYASLADSVQDYFIRQDYFNVIDSMLAETYVQSTMASGYTNEPGYPGAWIDLYHQLIVDGPPVADPVDPGPVADTGGNGGALALLLLGALAIAGK